MNAREQATADIDLMISTLAAQITPPFTPAYFFENVANPIREEMINSREKVFLAVEQARREAQQEAQEQEARFDDTVPPDLWTIRDRTRANIKAMQILAGKPEKVLTQEDRQTLLRYSGWGGLDLKKVASQIPESLLPELGGLTNEYYTPSNVTKDVANLVKSHYLNNLKPGETIQALEPSAGIGRFVNAFGREPRLNWTTVELSNAPAKLLAAARPDIKVFNMSFEEWVTQHCKDLYGKVRFLASNPPYPDRGLSATYDTDPRFYDRAAWRYFMLRGIDLMAPGGLSVWLVPAGFMTGKGPHSMQFRDRVLRETHLDYAFRLPTFLFPGAGLVTDLFFLRAREGMLVNVLDEDKFIADGNYFKAFPHHILGVEENAEDSDNEEIEENPEETPEKKKKGKFDRYKILGDYNGLPLVTPRTLSYGATIKPTGPKTAPHAEKSFIREALKVIEGGPEEVSSAGHLGVRFDTYSASVGNDEPKAVQLWNELHSDLLAWSTAYGNPHTNDSLKKAGPDNLAVQRFLQAFQRDGSLLPALAVAPKVERAYTGAADDYPAMAEYLYRQTRHLTWDELVSFIRDRNKSTKVLPVDPSLLFDTLAKNSWYFAGTTASRFHEVLVPEKDYLTGQLWPKYDVCLKVAADPMGGGTTAQQARDQAERLLTEIKPLLFEDIETFGPNEGWIPDSMLSQWLNDTYNPPEHGKAKTRQAKLEYKDGVYQLAGEDYFESTGTTEDNDAEPSGMPEIRRIIGWLNDDPELFKVSVPQGENESRLRLAAARKWIDSFIAWVRSHEDRVHAVTESYNRTFRGFIPPYFAPTDIERTIGRWQPDPSRAFRPYQQSAVLRLLHNRGGLVAHDVGLGKTLVGTATVALAKQEGWCKRPIIICPNTLIWNWYGTFSEALPDYRVGVIGWSLEPKTVGPKSHKKIVTNPITGKPVYVPRKEDAEARGAKWTKFQHGDFDVIIVPQSLIANTRMNKEFVLKYVERTSAIMREILIDQKTARQKIKRAKEKPKVEKDLKEARRELEREERNSWREDAETQKRIKEAKKEVAKLERELEEELAALTAREEATAQMNAETWVFEHLALSKQSKKKKDGAEEPEADTDGEPADPLADERYDVGVTWDSIGCDLLIIDESQNYKNLYMPTGKVKPAYLGGGKESKRSWQLDFRTEDVRQRTGGAGIVLLSATPAKNSPLEYYNALQYIDHDAWTNIGIKSPLQFIARYLNIKNALVVSQDGIPSYKPAVVGFKNTEELKNILYKYTDYKKAVRSDADGNVPIDQRNKTNVVPIATLPVAEVHKIYVGMLAEQRATFNELYARLKAMDPRKRMQKMGLKTLCSLGSVHPALSERVVLADAVEKNDEEYAEDGEAEAKKDEKKAKKDPKTEKKWDWSNANELPAHRLASPKFQAVTAKIKEFREADEAKRILARRKLAALTDMAERESLLNESDPDNRKRLEAELVDPAARKRFEREIADPGCGHLIFAQNVAAHRWLRQILIDSGIPADRIGVLNAEAATTPMRRQNIAEQFTGKEDRRVETADKDIEASTGEAPSLDVVIANSIAYEGLNLQLRTCAVHHIDLPWTPSDLQQRNGRSVRSGNRYAKVDVYYYLTQRSLDGTYLDKILGKLGWLDNLIPGTKGENNNPAADVNVDQFEMMLALCPNEEEADKIRAEWEVKKKELLTSETQADANAILRMEVVANVTRAKRLTKPEEKKRLMVLAELALKNLATVNATYWPFYSVAQHAMEEPMLVPEQGCPLYTGMTVLTGKDNYTEFGRIHDGEIGYREKGYGATSYSTWNHAYHRIPTKVDKKKNRWQPHNWIELLPENFVDAIPKELDEDIQKSINHLTNLGERRITPSSHHGYGSSSGSAYYPELWSDLGWMWASPAFLAKWWTPSWPKILHYLAGMGEAVVSGHHIPVLRKDRLHIVLSAVPASSSPSTSIVIKDSDTVIPPSPDGWTLFLSHIKEVHSTAAMQCAAWWWERGIPPEAFKTPPPAPTPSPAPLGGSKAAPACPVCPTSPGVAQGLSSGSMPPPRPASSLPESPRESSPPDMPPAVLHHYKPKGPRNTALEELIKNAKCPSSFDVYLPSKWEGTVENGFKYQYHSLYRPVWIGFTGSVGMTADNLLFHNYNDGTRSVIVTKEPIPIDKVLSLQLTPCGETIGQIIVDYAESLGVPVELTQPGRDPKDPRVAVLFKNPRNHWQMNYFDSDGPVTHTCGEEETPTCQPAKMVYESWRDGYKEFHPGALDRLAPGFDPEMLNMMSGHTSKPAALAEPVKTSETSKTLEESEQRSLLNTGVASRGSVTVKVVVHPSGDGFGVEIQQHGQRTSPSGASLTMEQARTKAGYILAQEPMALPREITLEETSHAPFGTTLFHKDSGAFYLKTVTGWKKRDSDLNFTGSPVKLADWSYRVATWGETPVLTAQELSYISPLPTSDRETQKWGEKVQTWKDVAGIFDEAHQVQEEFAASKGMTMEQIQALPPSQRPAIQAEYTAWLKAQGKDVPETHASPPKAPPHPLLTLVQKALFANNGSLVMPESQVAGDTVRLAFITEREAEAGSKILQQQGWKAEDIYQRSSSEPFLWFVMGTKTHRLIPEASP